VPGSDVRVTESLGLWRMRHTVLTLPGALSQDRISSPFWGRSFTLFLSLIPLSYFYEQWHWWNATLQSTLPDLNKGEPYNQG
jgi:hypothetical protein